MKCSSCPWNGPGLPSACCRQGCPLEIAILQKRDAYLRRLEGVIDRLAQAELELPDEFEPQAELAPPPRRIVPDAIERDLAAHLFDDERDVAEWMRKPENR